MTEAPTLVAITIISLLVASLILGYAVRRTTSTHTLADIGAMVSQLIIAIGKVIAEIITAVNR